MISDVKNKIQGLIDSANETTGKEDATLTDAIMSLKDGFGGGVEYTTGTLTFGTDYQGRTIPHGLSKAPKLFYLYWENFDKSTSVRLTFAIYSPKHGSVWYGDSVTPGVIHGGRPTIPGVHADPYSAISADETNVNITATARQREAGNWIWEAWTW